MIINNNTLYLLRKYNELIIFYNVYRLDYMMDSNYNLVNLKSLRNKEFSS